MGTSSKVQTPWLFLLDRDGVINHDIGAPGIVHPDEFELLPGAAATIADLNRQGHATCVVTNQSAVRKGLMTDETLHAIHAKMHRLLMEEAGARVDWVLYATGREGDECEMKPSPSMLLRGLHLSGVPVSRSIMIGDKELDVQAGQAAGCPATFLVTSSQHGQAAAELRRSAGGSTDNVCPDLASAVEAALAHLGQSQPAV